MGCWLCGCLSTSCVPFAVCHLLRRPQEPPGSWACKLPQHFYDTLIPNDSTRRERQVCGTASIYGLNLWRVRSIHGVLVRMGPRNSQRLPSAIPPHIAQSKCISRSFRVPNAPHIGPCQGALCIATAPAWAPALRAWQSMTLPSRATERLRWLWQPLSHLCEYQSGPVLV